MYREELKALASAQIDFQFFADMAQKLFTYKGSKTDELVAFKEEILKVMEDLSKESILIQSTIKEMFVS